MQEKKYTLTNKLTVETVLTELQASESMEINYISVFLSACLF